MKRLKMAVRAFVAAALLAAGAGTARAEPPATFTPGPNQSLVVFHTRVATGRKYAEGRLTFRPYDRATGRLGGDGFDPPGNRFTVGRWIGIVSNAGMQRFRGWAVPVEPGSYVIASMENPHLTTGGTSILPVSWAFDVPPGSVTYIGDFILQFTRVRGGWLFDILPEIDEARARAFIPPMQSAPFVSVPLRRVALSRDNPERQWKVTDLF